MEGESLELGGLTLMGWRDELARALELWFLKD